MDNLENIKINFLCGIPVNQIDFHVSSKLSVIQLINCNINLRNVVSFS